MNKKVLLSLCICNTQDMTPTHQNKIHYLTIQIIFLQCSHPHLSAELIRNDCSSLRTNYSINTYNSTQGVAPWYWLQCFNRTHQKVVFNSLLVCYPESTWNKFINQNGRINLAHWVASNISDLIMK